MWPYQLASLLFIKALCSIVFFYHHYRANYGCWAECSSYMTTCLAKIYNIAVAISLKFVGNRHGWKISLVWGKPTATNNPPKKNPKRILIFSSDTWIQGPDVGWLHWINFDWTNGWHAMWSPCYTPQFRTNMEAKTCGFGWGPHFLGSADDIPVPHVSWLVAWD